MAARRRAQPAKPAKSHIIERGSVTEDDTTASRLRTSLTGTSGLTLATSARSRAAIADGSAEERTTRAIDRGIWRFEGHRLRVGHVHRARDLGGRAAGQRVLAHVPHHPHDRPPVLVPDHADALADRVLVRPVAPRGGGAHHHDRRRALPVGVLEAAPLQQRNAHDPEVRRASPLPPRAAAPPPRSPRGDGLRARRGAAVARRSAERRSPPPRRRPRSGPRCAAAARRRAPRRPTAPRTSPGSGTRAR